MMQIEFPALHSEPLIYFLLHSGVFVLILGALFFALGLWFGALTWGKFKVQSKATHEENQALLGEIAVLKRKVTEQSMRPTSTPNAAPAASTEELPNLNKNSPEHQSTSHARAAAPTVSATEPNPPIGTTKPVIRAKTKPAAAEETLPVVAETQLEAEPFGLPLAEPTAAISASEAEDASALDSIIKGKPGTKSEGDTAGVQIPPTPPPVKIPEPEMDPALGPIYREAPPNADDLTKIKGIATVLEKRLHELGIHTYRQIASWEENHIREFSTRLAFKDRIAREGWVQQAQNLEKLRQSV